jgi:hypothetical protein
MHQMVMAQTKLPVKLGIKIAPNLAWMSPSTKDYSSDGITGGATVGFVSDIYFMERYAFSTGFNFSFLNGKIKYQDQLIISGDTLTGTLARKYNLIYFEVPLLIKMQTKKFGRFSFYGQIGFGTGFRIAASAKDTFESSKGVYDQKSDVREETTLIRESVIVGLGTEYHLDQSSRLFFGLNYSNSLNNVLNGVNDFSNVTEKAWLNSIELNLGILF